MYKFTTDQKFHVLLLLLGALLILLGYFDIKDFKKFELVIRPNPLYLLFVFGCIFSFISILLFTIDKIDIGNLYSNYRVSKLENGYSINCSNVEINLLYGRIEIISDRFEDSLIILPANEYFDDECIKDPKSSLGAYITNKFPNQSDQIKTLIANELRNKEAVEIEKEEGVKAQSYGVGTGVLLRRPLNTNKLLLFISVTTKRKGEGLKSELSYILKGIEKIISVAADTRNDSVCIPVLGSGHGGIRKEAALFALLIAICDNIRKPHGHLIKKFNIVIFQPDKKSRPEISKSNSKKIMKISTSFYA